MEGIAADERRSTAATLLYVQQTCKMAGKERGLLLHMYGLLVRPPQHGHLKRHAHCEATQGGRTW